MKWVIKCFNSAHLPKIFRDFHSKNLFLCPRMVNTRTVILITLRSDLDCMTHNRHFSLLNQKGRRKYLNQKERIRFYKHTKDLPFEKQVFCQLLYFTGARISEISELKIEQLDFSDRVVIIRTLKKRRTDIYRQIPLPDALLKDLYTLTKNGRATGKYNGNTQKIWSFSTRTGARIIKQVMLKAKIDNIRASALGLRHGFAVHAVTHVPITQVQKWMGHAHLSTTNIYLQVSGNLEREWAQKLWDEEE